MLPNYPPNKNASLNITFMLATNNLNVNHLKQVLRRDPVGSLVRTA